MGGRWRLGPFELSAEHRPFELRFGWQASQDPLQSSIHIECPTGELNHQKDSALVRFSLENDHAKLLMEPRLADRPVVVRPSIPFWVMGRETVSLYLSTPLWVQVSVDGFHKPLLDVPSIALSDTWFGSSTRRGELCYASRTQARLDPDRLPNHPMRATTRLVIHNRLPSALLVERVKIPTTYLSLYLGTEGRLWTQAVHVERTQTEGAASIRLEKPANVKDSGAKRLAPPRKLEESTLLKRALDALIG